MERRFGIQSFLICNLLILSNIDGGYGIRVLSQPILERPESLIDVRQKVQYAVEGSSYKMKCSVNGEAIILWKVDGGFPDEPKYKILPDFNLLIRNVSQEDFKREYICSAVVPKFRTVESMRIELKPLPRREAKVFNQEQSSSTQNGNNNNNNNNKEIFAVIGELKTLTCSVNARPNPEFKWLYQNETLIQNGTDMIITSREDTSNLTIFIRDGDLYGTYLCEAWNTLGRMKQSFSLKMPQKPRDIPFIYPKNIGQSKITFGANYDKSQNYSLHLQFKSISSEKWQERSFGVSEDLLDVGELKPNTTYLIRAALSSKFIDGDYSEPIRVTTDKAPHDLNKDKVVNRDGRGRSLNSQEPELQDGDSKVINSTVWTSTKMIKLGNRILISRTIVEEVDDEV